MPDFPYFKSSTDDFPGLRALDGQSYRDTYDYGQYRAPAKLRLLSVPWRSDYRDVVRFDDEAARDAWFSRQTPEIIEYSTPWLRIPAQTVNIPLPYERAAHFNYLYLDVPELPVEGSDAPTRLFYFVRDIRYAAPSTTALELELDVWQTYGYRMDVDSLILERGHAPMYRSSVDAFLADPVNNNRYLLAKDVDYSNGSERVAAVEHYPVGSGEKWLVMALPIAPGDLAAIGAPGTGASTPPAYYDVEARNGYQLGVDGYRWAHDGRSYATSALPATSGASSDGRTLDGSYIYGIVYPDARAALAALAANAPQALAAAAYIAIIPAALVSVAGSYSIAGSTWALLDANPNVRLEAFELTKDHIGLPEYAADIAKCYTWPYTRLMVQDQEGRGFEVRIEDIAGNALEFNADISLASATLMCNIEATNVGTDDALTMEWQQLDGAGASTLYGSDLAAHTIEWGIPTYEVKLSAGTLEAARRWRDLESKRQAALNSYRQAVRGANTGYENNAAGNATTVANTSRSNAASVANTQNSGNTATANQVISNNRDNTITAQNVATSSQLGDLSHQNAYDLSNADIEFQMYAVDVGTWGSAMAGVNNAVGSLATGDVMGAISTGFGAAISISTNQAMATLASDAASAKQGAAVDYIDDSTTERNAQMNANNTTNVNAATNINTNNVALANANAANSAAASNANAAASAATSNSNAGYSRADSVTSAKENLEQAQRAALAALDAASLELARTGSTTGDNALDALNRRAFSIKTVTQSDYALRAAAEQFRRFGYALNMPITPESWLEQGDFCYWQGTRAIIRGNVPDVYRTALASILEQGTTVWKSPEKVGNYGR